MIPMRPATAAMTRAMSQRRKLLRRTGVDRVEGLEATLQEGDFGFGDEGLGWTVAGGCD